MNNKKATYTAEHKQPDTTSSGQNCLYYTAQINTTPFATVRNAQATHTDKALVELIAAAISDPFYAVSGLPQIIAIDKVKQAGYTATKYHKIVNELADAGAIILLTRKKAATRNPIGIYIKASEGSGL